MAKNIIVCSDGTGNTAIKDRGTNVFKLFEAADLNGHRSNPLLTPQLAIYDDGVGTESFKPLQIVALATGLGLAGNVRQLYKELSRLYDPGDKIFLFGFSRGAFTVRTLAGMIHQCGILDMNKISTAAGLRKKVRQAYSAYRKSYRTELVKLFRGEPDRSPAQRFREENCLKDETAIDFVGVWDTVDSVGTPFHISDIINMTLYRYKFPDRKLNASVKRACQALAVDEARDAFTPLPWDDDPRIEQVWFAGVHSNVGGGYPKQGMSLVALNWIFERAGAAGLRLIDLDRDVYKEHASVEDHLYNSRAGVGVFYRWLPRDMQAICQEAGVQPRIHVSVLERVAYGTDDYAPGTLAPTAAVTIMENPGDPTYHILRDRADRMERALHAAHAGGGPLLDRVRVDIFFGRLSYYLYLIACVGAFLAAAVPPDEPGSRWNPLVILKNAAMLLWDGVSGQWPPIVLAIRRLILEPEFIVPIVASLLFSWWLSRLVDARMSWVFSEFWHTHAPDLRDQLKQAHRAAGGK